ncbi:hypothetical protein GTC6_15988 [Gordonia terrae C-6]|uniref:Lipoprotein n=1 Tax=Gordonia terrae C-6 TaxID=1316928 RepID=R7Y701_9ACTN|nr:hypothetical protein [Gordonia terrae]EON31792.1 hypothetical protein GTC6_15988 [Gordonia terrae C-6]
MLRNRWRPWWAGVAAVLGLAGLLACGTPAPTERVPVSSTADSSSPSQPTKVLTTGPRRDIEPVAARFPALADSTVDGWAAGTLGDASTGRVPGPSTYWFDAVVTAGADQVAEWVQEYDATPVPHPDPPVSALHDLVPAGELLGSPELDRAFSSTQWRARVYLSPASGRVVVLGIDD